MSTAKPPALSPSKITHPRKKSEDLCPLLQLLSAVEREDAQSGIDQSPLFFVAVGSEEARRPVTKDSTFILQQLQSSSKIEFDKEWVHLRKSNTEPIIRIYSESETAATADHLARKIIADIKEVIHQ